MPLPAGSRSILSERDIVRAVAKRGTAVFNDAVSMHMTAEVMTTSEDEHVHEAMDKMTDGGFAISPSSAMNKLVGLVSIGDLVKHRLAECEYEQKAMREYIATACATRRNGVAELSLAPLLNWRNLCVSKTQSRDGKSQVDGRDQNPCCASFAHQCRCRSSFNVTEAVTSS